MSRMFSISSLDMSCVGVLLLHPASAISRGTSSESMAIRCFILVVTRKRRFYYNI